MINAGNMGKMLMVISIILKGANIGGFVRVADAMLAEGHV
jgi:hypothetical protein